MLVTAILSGDEETLEKKYQSKSLLLAVSQLSILDAPLTIVLDSGQRITISKVLEGGDPSTRLLTADIN